VDTQRFPRGLFILTLDTLSVRFNNDHKSPIFLPANRHGPARSPGGKRASAGRYAAIIAPRAAALPVSLDLALTAPGRVFVRGRGLQSEWSLDMRARGEAGALNLTGEARLIRGDFRLAGRPFAVSQGRVRFVGPVEEAELAIEANQTSANLSARLNVAGPLAKPEITFSSSPSLPPDEILPQIAFGRSGADLSPLEAAQIAASLAELSGQAAFDLAGAARGVDHRRVRLRRRLLRARTGAPGTPT
jgi:autotransporter translocation and assembly factor TamB